MRRFKMFLAAILTISLLTCGVPLPPLQASPANDRAAAPSAPVAPSWPKTFDRDGNHIVVYQPQLKSWEKYRTLVADTAISITPKDAKQILGVISWRADTIANVSTRTVYVHDIEVLSSRFPSLDPADEAQMEARFRQIYPTMTFTISLDRMIASLEKSKAPVQSISPSPQVPTIFVSTVPAISLMVDGKPILAPDPGHFPAIRRQYQLGSLLRKSDYYLLNGKTWLKAKEIEGPWTVTAKIPADMAKLPTDQNWGDVLKAVPPPAGASAAPKVFVYGKARRIDRFQGQARLRADSRHQPFLRHQYGKHIFLHKPDNQVYVLISGRWFRAGNLEAPWVFAGNDLPADFAKIPPNFRIPKLSFPFPERRMPVMPCCSRKFPPPPSSIARRRKHP